LRPPFFPAFRLRRGLLLALVEVGAVGGAEVSVVLAFQRRAFERRGDDLGLGDLQARVLAGLLRGFDASGFRFRRFILVARLLAVALAVGLGLLAGAGGAIVVDHAIGCQSAGCKRQ